MPSEDSDDLSDEENDKPPAVLELNNKTFSRWPYTSSGNRVKNVPFLKVGKAKARYGNQNDMTLDELVSS